MQFLRGLRWAVAMSKVITEVLWTSRSDLEQKRCVR